jgi:hypothetical protein
VRVFWSYAEGPMVPMAYDGRHVGVIIFSCSCSSRSGIDTSGGASIIILIFLIIIVRGIAVTGINTSVGVDTCVILRR